MNTRSTRALSTVAFLVTAALALPSDAACRHSAGGDPLVHIRVLDGIASANGGNRAAGTSGYDRSADYVAETLRGVGYAVRFEEFTFPFFEERSPPRLSSMQPGGIPSEASAEEIKTLSNSGTGDATGPIRAVDLGIADGTAPTRSTSGCEESDFDNFPVDAIALVRRGTCPFGVKVENATLAGAAGVIVMNEGGERRTDAFRGALGQPAAIPVVAVSYELGRTLAAVADEAGTTVRVSIDAVSGTRSTRNVLAERSAPTSGSTVVVGAHLDSVERGPGINDNASGTAVLIEAALRLADDSEVGPSAPHLLFAFWGAEELGLIGSRHHVSHLTDEERERVALYINIDMVGSPNYGRFVLGSRTAPGSLADAARASLLGFFNGRDLSVEDGTGERRQHRGYGSDDASFADKGIPTLGLYTGAGETKSDDAAARFGGTPGRPYDPCYHQACDTIGNVAATVLDEMASALTKTLRVLSVGKAVGAILERS